MPHLQLEMSRGLAIVTDVKALLSQLVAEFCTHETIDSKSVKAYARVSDNWVMGEGAPPEFIHLAICVLAGRDPSLIRRISDSLYSVLKARVQTEASVTLEVRQMDPAAYHK